MAVNFNSADKVLEFASNAMSPAQRRLESGDKQFDKDGKPLVGRYRDGTTPAKGKEAYGTSQIQIKTARNTAKKHGIPWDEQKLLYDKGYNARLGDLHMSDLKKTYNGDMALVYAAYHSGEPAVNRALARHGRSGFLNGLGPEGRNYVKKLTGERAGRSSGGGSAEAVLADVVSINPASPEEYAQFAGQDKTFGVADPFVSEVTAGMQSQKLADAMSEEAKVLADSTEIQQEIQERRLERLQDAAADKKELLGMAENVTNVFSNRYRELVNHRDAVQAKEDEVANMNPIARFFKRVGNPEYRRSTIAIQQNIFKREMKDAEDDWKAGISIIGQNVDALNQSFDLDDKISILESDNATQDIQLAEKKSVFAGRSLSRIIESVQQQTVLSNAQEKARIDVMESMTDEMVMASLNAAKAGGGKAKIQGIEFNEAELQRTADARVQFQTSMQAQQLSLQAGKLNLADTLEDRAIESMTPEMRSKALEAGGLYQGQQLNVGKLTAAVARDRAATAEAVNRAQITEAPARLQNTVVTLGKQVQGSGHMLAQTYGYMPQGFQTFTTKFTREMDAITKALEEGTKRGLGRETAARLQPIADKLAEEYQAAINSAAKDFGGSDTSLQAIGKAWFTGAPLAPQEAANGIIAWSQGGLPSGVVATGETKEILNRAGQVVAAAVKRNGGKVDRKVLQPMVIRAIGEQVADMRLQRVLDGMPTLAAKHKSPLRQISKQDWRHAFELGDETGLEAAADEVGLSVEEAQAKARTDPKLAAKIMAAQTQSTMKYLDAQFGGPDFVPSQEMAKLFSNEQFLRDAHGMAVQFNQASLPDFVVTQIAGPDFTRQLGAYAKSVTAAGGAARKQAMRDATLDSVQLRNNPFLRTQFILNSVPGVSKSERAMFLDYLQRAIPGMKKEYKQPSAGNLPTALITGIASVGGGHGLSRARGLDATATNGAADVMDRVTATINTKIEDPTLESIRKRILGDWASASELLTRGFEN